MHCRKKKKNLEKNGTFKNKNIQCPAENKNKRFNDRVKVILSRKKIEEGQKQKYVNVKINGENIKLQFKVAIYLLLIF